MQAPQMSFAHPTTPTRGESWARVASRLIGVGCALALAGCLQPGIAGGLPGDDDAGQLPVDTGRPTMDAGQGSTDAGQLAMDAGQGSTDAGQLAMDAGQDSLDAGALAADGGQPIIPSVTYDANGGTGTPPASGTLAAGASLSVEGVGALRRSGSYFNGWSTNTSGTGTSYSPGQIIEMPASQLILYAKWVPIIVPPASTWQSVKIGGGGYVPGLIFHPTTPDLLYARTDIGGVYRWDGESRWIAITDGFGWTEGAYIGAESVALDPTDAQRVYLTTGQYVNGGESRGRLYVSSNQGTTWTHVDLPFAVGSNNQGRAIGERLMVDPNLPSTLYYGTRTAGLWRSTDSGATWSKVVSLSSIEMTKAQVNADSWGSPAGVEFVVFDTTTSNSGSATKTLYVGVAPDYASAAMLPSNLYRSTDSGATWTGLSTPVTGAFIPHMVRATDGAFYVAFVASSGPGAGGPASLYRLEGDSWTLLRSETPGQWVNFGYGGLSVYGSGPTTRIALGITNSWGKELPIVALSNDQGTTWSEIAGGPGGTPHTPEGNPFGWVDDVEIDPFDPERVLHVFGGGVWATLNASATKPSWVLLVEGIEEAVANTLLTPPPGASYLLVSAHLDLGTLVHTSLTTTPTLGPSGELALSSSSGVDVAWSNPAYLATIGAPAKGKPGSFSTDSGKTWTAFASFPPDAGTNASSEANLAVTAPNKLVWAMSNAVPYSSADNGASWEATDLPGLPWVGWNRAYRLAADRQNPNKVYAYDSGGAWWNYDKAAVYVSTDGGRTFVVSSLSGLAANGFFVTSLAVNPYAEGDVWLADGNNLYHSTDSAKTWTKLTTMASVWGDGPRSTPTYWGALQVALGKPGPTSSYSAAVYLIGTVGGTAGVFRSDDAGASWTRVNDDAHQYGGVGRIAADHNTFGRIYLAGGGRGVVYNSP